MSSASEIARQTFHEVCQAERRRLMPPGEQVQRGLSRLALDLVSADMMTLDDEGDEWARRNVAPVERGID